MNGFHFLISGYEDKFQRQIQNYMESIFRDLNLS